MSSDENEKSENAEGDDKKAISEAGDSAGEAAEEFAKTLKEGLEGKDEGEKHE